MIKPLETKARPPVAGWIALAVTFWVVSAYVHFSGDPTHIFITSRFTGVARDPDRIASIFFFVGLVLFSISLFRRYFTPR
jgi:uncharacterized membrane protein YtjA (UPF0391 family)